MNIIQFKTSTYRNVGVISKLRTMISTNNFSLVNDLSIAMDCKETVYIDGVKYRIAKIIQEPLLSGISTFELEKV